ncbi:MAG: MetS family NSS transporter small subunit [Deltaproteobacteria bacterium]|nr:MAG: MetS family NSS transporter small subunit [Deltaproteobacteria bacterium]
MSTGAWIMLIFGCVVLYGGLAWSLLRAKRGRRQ